MNLQPHHSTSLQSLHEILSLLGDVFCQQICKKCNWSTADFYFHLHNPGHLTKTEKRKINKAVYRTLVDALAQVPKIDSRVGDRG